MSTDFMLLRPDATLGRDRDVLSRAKRAGIDLAADSVEFGGAVAEFALDVARGQVECVHVNVRRGDPRALLHALAAALGAEVFDNQTGRGLDEPAPIAPDRSDDYRLQLVGYGDSIGIEPDVRRALDRSLPTSGEGWTARVEIVLEKGVVARVELRTSFRNGAARNALFAAVTRAAEAEGWVPFDPQMNDTLP